ncbi:MAG: hypothetical protein ABL890_03810 [Candidatus Peribacteraceae bacterium]
MKLSLSRFTGIALAVVLVPSVTLAATPMLSVTEAGTVSTGTSSSAASSALTGVPPPPPPPTCDTSTNLIDNGDPGHRTIGQWVNSPTPNSAYGNDQLQQVSYAWNRQTDATQVRSLWKFDCLTPGTYDVFVTWSLDQVDHKKVSTNAPFTLFQNGRRVRTVRINERRGPAGHIQYQGRSWTRTHRITVRQGATLQLNLANNSTTGMVLADAVYVRQVLDR